MVGARALARRASVLGAIVTAALVVALQGLAAGPGDVVCSQATNEFSGSARDLVVPADGKCNVANATIAHDLLVRPGGALRLARTTIGHDVVATRPHTVQTGETGPPPAPSGPVSVGHDFVIDGSPAGEAFHGLCDLTVGHDLRVVNTTVDLGIGIGAN